MIKPKLKICSVCEKPSYLWKSSPPMCKSCAGKASGKTVISSKPKALTEFKKSFKDELNTFFTNEALKMPFNCMECGKPLYASNKFAKRCCTAHILAKSDFPSIATNPDNIIFLGCGLLGVCQCHSTFDSNADTRVKMRVFPLVLERFEKLKLLLTDKELIKAYTALKIEFGNIENMQEADLQAIKRHGRSNN